MPGVEDPLEKGMAAHSSVLVWRIPWTEALGRLQSVGGCKESDKGVDWSDSPLEHFLSPVSIALTRALPAVSNIQIQHLVLENLHSLSHHGLPEVPVSERQPLLPEI